MDFYTTPVSAKEEAPGTKLWAVEGCGAPWGFSCSIRSETVFGLHLTLYVFALLFPAKHRWFVTHGYFNLTTHFQMSC